MVDRFSVESGTRILLLKEEPEKGV